jgi:DNA-binding NarL/FixJ family response regulator
MVRVLVVEDHALIREGLRSFLESYGDVEVVGEAITGEEALASVDRLLPEVVVMDINMPDMDGIAATRRIHVRYPAIPIIGLTVMSDESYLRAMLDAGAFRVLTKGEGAVEGLYQAVREAAASINGTATKGNAVPALGRDLRIPSSPGTPAASESD